MSSSYYNIMTRYGYRAAHQVGVSQSAKRGGLQQPISIGVCGWGDNQSDWSCVCEIMRNEHNPMFQHTVRLANLIFKYYINT